MMHSEYTYDTADPGYDQVINLIYENAKYAEKKEQPTEKETKPKKKKAVAASANVIVPTPKITGRLYNAQNIGRSLKDVMDRFYIVTEATSLYSGDIPIKSALNENFKIKGNNTKPQILIYHTHSQEEFADSSDYVSVTIIGVGDRLAKILKSQFGYNVIHDTTKYDIVNGKLDRSEAYDQARE